MPRTCGSSSARGSPRRRTTWPHTSAGTGDAFTDGQLIDTITPRVATARAKNTNDVSKRAEPVWDPKVHKQSWRAVWAYSAKRAARDHKTLTMQENKAKAVVAGDKAARTPRFVKTTNGTIRLDEAALARARRLVGLKGYLSNLPATIMPASEIINSYHSLWQVTKPRSDSARAIFVPGPCFTTTATPSKPTSPW